MPSTVEVDTDGSGGSRDDAAPFDAWFDQEYPRIVGLVRRVLDRSARTDASSAVAEDLTVEAFSRVGRRRTPGPAATTRVLHLALAGCMEALVGHPGVVALPERSGHDDDLVGLPLAELQEVLSTMRIGDRRTGLLVFAAGYSPSDAAVLLQRPLDRVLAQVGRVTTRIGDARRLGLTGPVPDVVRTEAAR